MSFDDDSRIVVKEGQPPPPAPPSRPASSSKKEVRKSTSANTAPSPSSPHCGGGKPDGFGTITCVQTFPTGLVVSTGSDGTVSRGGAGKTREGNMRRCLLSRVFCCRGVSCLALFQARSSRRSNIRLTQSMNFLRGQDCTAQSTMFSMSTRASIKRSKKSFKQLLALRRQSGGYEVRLGLKTQSKWKVPGRLRARGENRWTGSCR